MSKSILQDGKYCYLSGAVEKLHRHHIFGGCRRATSERWGCWVWLREDLHNMSGRGVHFDGRLNARLKDECQRRFEDLYGHGTFMAAFGKNYLRPEFDPAPAEEGRFRVIEEELPFGQ